MKKISFVFSSVVMALEIISFIACSNPASNKSNNDLDNNLPKETPENPSNDGIDDNDDSESDDDNENKENEELKVYQEFLKLVGNNIYYVPGAFDSYTKNFKEKIYSLQFKENEIVITRLSDQKQFVFDINEAYKLKYATKVEPDSEFARGYMTIAGGYEITLNNPMESYYDVGIEFTTKYFLGPKYIVDENNNITGEKNCYTEHIDIQCGNSKKFHQDLSSRLEFYLYNDDLKFAKGLK